MVGRTSKVDTVVIGSGFSGSLLAWILASQGRRVTVIDRQRHPRFAIGESSTPTADFLLAHLADRWGLHTLAPLACWGTWKSRYPDVQCGKKRGFSYYRHHPMVNFQDDQQHNQSLLVAASASDRWSDTHWLRSSVDHFLAQRAQAAGVQLLEEHTVLDARYDSMEKRWQVDIASESAPKVLSMRVSAPWIVDASGPGNALSRFVFNPADDQWMRTRTQAIFGHFSGVAPFESARSPDDPFCGDDAAQHHVLDRGWCWMLRMDHGITSVGLVSPCESDSSGSPLEESFQQTIDMYPSLSSLMRSATRIAPDGGMGTSGRMSRCRTHASGPGWVLLPVTYGFVDPLHSSGIAHALSGVMRLSIALLSEPAKQRELIHAYALDLRREVDWLDTLVAGCYCAQPAFDSFIAFASFYFIAAIQFEKQLAADPSVWPLGFLQCHDPSMNSVVQSAYSELTRASSSSSRPDSSFVDHVRRWIEPWNDVGLLSPAARNRIAHSAAPKYASIAKRGTD